MAIVTVGKQTSIHQLSFLDRELEAMMTLQQMKIFLQKIFYKNSVTARDGMG